MPPQNCFPKNLFKVVKDFKDLKDLKDLKDFKEKSAESFFGAFIGISPLRYLMRS